MPNWCLTNVTFYSENQLEVRNFYDKVLSIYHDNPTSDNGFGKGWLGDYLQTFFPNEKSELTEIRHRGYITEFSEYTPCEFTIRQETAWSPIMKLWKLIIDTHYPDIKLAYIAEECGMEIYEKYDPDCKFCDNYLLEFQTNKNGNLIEYYEYFDSIKSIYQTIKEYFNIDCYGKTVDEINLMIAPCIDMDAEEYFYLREFVDSSEWAFD